MQFSSDRLASKIKRYAWYIRRIRSMGPAEIIYRGAQQARRARWRLDSTGWIKFDLPDGELRPLGNVARALSCQMPPALLAALEESMRGIEAGRLVLLGVSWPQELFSCLSPDVWLVDPVTANPWPGAKTYCFDVEYRHGDRFADVKFVWEINRLQFLQAAAALFIRNPSPDRRDWIMQAISSWMEANPPFRGVNWVSGIEIALRLVSVSIVVSCLSDHLSAEHRRLLRSFVAAHTFWLRQHPSLFSSANNHRVAEGLGLVVGALLAPDLEDAASELAEGHKVLEWALQTQFHSDGIGVEQSPSYSSFTLEMLAYGALALRDLPSTRNLPEDKFVRPALALKAFLDDRGHVPNIGDNDEGRVIVGPIEREPRYVASVTAAIAGIVGDPRMAPSSTDAQLRDMVFSSPDCSHSRARETMQFAQGGYSVFHGNIAGREADIIFDHGPVGFEPLAAHGHADALALWLTIDGTPIFIDAGTYLYHSGGKLREYFRSSSAHNTLELVGESQSKPSGAFNWRHKASSRLMASQMDSPFMVRARHDGYLSTFGLMHERTIQIQDDSIWVMDCLVGAERRLDVVISFLVNPELRVEIDGACTLIFENSSYVASLLPPSSTPNADFDMSLSQAPYSRNFGHLGDTTRIQIRGSVRTGTAFTTRIRVSR